MKKRTYICTVVSNSTREREYVVETSSAVKAAKELGRCEAGEVITVYTKSGNLLSQARWGIEERKYYRCAVWEGQ